MINATKYLNLIGEVTVGSDMLESAFGCLVKDTLSYVNALQICFLCFDNSSLSIFEITSPKFKYIHDIGAIE